MGHLFHDAPINFSREPLFLGTGRNIARLDLNLEPGITKMHESAMGKLWFAGDFSYSKDATDYIKADPKLRNLYMKNFKFQTFADSVAARSVAEVFLPITTNPELETWWYQHAFFENCVHSQTYADILKGLPVDSKAIFDDIMLNPDILKRASSIISCFEDTVKHNSRMILDLGYDKELHKKSIVLSLFALNILEAVYFKSSFITSFAFKEQGLFSITADAITKIALDEIGHYAMTVNLLNRLRADPEWAYIFHDFSDEIDKLYSDAIQADFMWIDYLFEDGVKLMGVNKVILKQYVTYNLHSVMTSVKQTPILDKVPNPCVWSNKYSKPSGIQTAQKEKTSGNYLLGIVDTNVNWNKLSSELPGNSYYE